ncbi:MAG: hypothetical protein GY696_18890 [Gammaproteobacteria bacterium]|nr:hypothetical protein [Gammaproteobacteria bacterium]
MADIMPLTFVNFSKPITDTATTSHEKTKGIYTGDITEIAGVLPISRIVIACRISAYWDSPIYFEPLADSLLSFPREIILIDFFNRDLVNSKTNLEFINECKMEN